MCAMRIRVFPTDRITPAMIAQVYMSGLDRVAWPMRVGVDGEELLLHRATSDSGNLHVPWPVDQSGPITLTTGTLMERPEPYLLPLEIARGVLVQLRNQLSEWQLMGLSVPRDIQDAVAEAVRRFSWAVVSQDDLAVCSEHAEAAIRSALATADKLADLYIDQALTVRRRNGAKLPSLLGADLGSTLLDNHTARQFLRAFNAAKVPIRWRDVETTEGSFSWSTTDQQIEWCRKHGRKVVAGPLLLLDSHDLPYWFSLFEDDFDSALEFSSAFVRAAVERYRGKVDYWICAGRPSDSEAMTLTEQERLGLVARIIELVRALDPDTPTLVSLDQPWAAYMRDRDCDFPPLQFADALIRAGLGLAGVMLEMNTGYWPGGSLRRHPLEYSRLLDIWSYFGLPLWVSLCAPSGCGDDPSAVHRQSLPENGWTPGLQAAWAARHVALALAKVPVQGVFWNQLRDAGTHDFAHGGLFDAKGKSKPAFKALATIRHTQLE